MHKFLKYAVVAYIASTAFVLGAIQVIEPSDSMATTRSKINANFAELGGSLTNGLATVLGFDDSAAGLDITDIGIIYGSNATAYIDIDLGKFEYPNSGVRLSTGYLLENGKANLQWHNSYLADFGGVWKSEGEATSGEEIVNFQTMTNHLATSHDLQAVLTAGNDAGGLNIDNAGTGNFDTVNVGSSAAGTFQQSGNTFQLLHNYDDAIMQLNTAGSGAAIYLYGTNFSSALKGDILMLAEDTINIRFDGGTTDFLYIDDAGVYPATDSSIDLGGLTNQWSNVYATTYYGTTAASNSTQLVNYQTMTNVVESYGYLTAPPETNTTTKTFTQDQELEGTLYVVGDAGYEDIKLGTEGAAINWESSRVGFGTTNAGDTVGVGYFDTNNGIVNQGVLITPTQIQFAHDLSNAVYRFRMGGANISYMTPSNFYPAVSNDYDLGRSVYPWRNIYAAGTVSANAFAGSGAALTDLPADTSATAIPYIITHASTVTVTRANGWLQAYTPTSTTTILIEDGGTSGVDQVNLSLYAGTNSVTLGTGNVTFATAITPATNDTTTILYYSPYLNTTWEGSEL